MAEKKLQLVDWYTKALHNDDIHMCTSLDLADIDVENLFIGRNALLFIRNYFDNLRTNYVLKNPADKFLEVLDRITEFRAQHTVASFLLGVVVKEELSLDMRNWIRLYDSKSSDASFGFFWSLICLTHDVAYHWERNSKKMIEQVLTVEDFCLYNNVQYNLLDKTEHADLIRNYYRYRVGEDNKIDHGITGAILVYDALMTFYYEGTKQSQLNLCGLRLRKNFPVFCLRIAETVALHNMWRATNKTAAKYRQYNLGELIPDGSDNEKVLYKEDALLFLLGLIDTIDPIKGFCSTEGNRPRIPPKDVLHGFYIRFVKRSGVKKMRLEFENSKFIDKYMENIVGMEKWLDVSINRTAHYEVEISIHMEWMKQENIDINIKSA